MPFVEAVIEPVGAVAIAVVGPVVGAVGREVAALPGGGEPDVFDQLGGYLAQEAARDVLLGPAEDGA